MRTRLLNGGSVLACLALGCGGKSSDENGQRAQEVSATGGTQQTGGTGPTGTAAGTRTSVGGNLGGTSGTIPSAGASATSAGGAHAGGALPTGIGGSTGGRSATTQGGTHVPVDLDAGCARQVDLEPAEGNVVFLLDKSGSMGDQLNSVTGEYDWQNCELRWNPVVQAEILRPAFS